MPKTKIKVGISFVLMAILFLISHQFLLFINYFMALVFHEMAHVYVAKSKGYNTHAIKIDMLGASIKLDNKIHNDDMFYIALAGPLSNFLICLLCTSLWWIVPEMYVFTADFFRFNLLIASFNLLPVQPLDGSKILESIVSKKSKHFSKVINLTINICAVIMFLALFVASCFVEINFIYLSFAIFFAINLIPEKKVNFDVYYKLFFKKNKPVQKINFLRVEPSCNLLDLIKQTKEGYYTIFYCEIGEPRYITEQELQLLIATHSLADTIKEVLD